MNGVHDMGGMHGFGPVAVENDEPVFHGPWEGRVYGLQRGMRAARLMNLDEFRHAQERLSPGQYVASTYYERWLAAMEQVIRDGGARPHDETLPEHHADAVFAPGDRVVARTVNPRGHTRLPRYARGKHGVVEAVHGPFLLPDTNAHYRGLDWEPVYTVVFEARELWGEDAEPRSRVSLDLWQSYLEGGSS
jgi:hypothetical protein